MEKLRIAGALVLTVSALCVSGCKQEVVKAAPPAPPKVVVAKAIQKEVVPYEIRTGTLSANQTVNVLPKVNAFVETIPFRPGQFIQAGAVLFTLDKKTFQSELDQAKATLAVRKSDVEVAKAQLAVAKANLQNADDEWARQDRLQKQQATSEKDYLNAKNNQRGAAASVQAAEAALGSADAAVLAADAAVAAAQVNVNYCTITSPMAGKVDINNVDVGDLVSPASAKSLTTVREIDPIKVDFSLNESFVVDHLRKKGLDKEGKPAVPVKVSLGDENDFRYDAMLDFASNTNDQATGTLPVRATAKNPDFKLYPGLFVRVKLNLDPLPNAIVVTESAISRDIGGDFVWVIQPDNTAEKRYIKMGPLVEKLRVVQSGLKADETYVVQGIQRVRERAKVTPEAAGDAAATQPAK